MTPERILALALEARVPEDTFDTALLEMAAFVDGSEDRFSLLELAVRHRRGSDFKASTMIDRARWFAGLCEAIAPTKSEPIIEPSVEAPTRRYTRRATRTE